MNSIFTYLCTVIWGCLWTSSALMGQSKGLAEMELELLESYRSMMDPLTIEDVDRFMVVIPAFKTQLRKVLMQPGAMDYPFDSLAKRMVVRSSEDGNVRTFSWDEWSGGTWHDMAAFAQFKTSSGKVASRQLDTDREPEMGEYTDVGIYKVYQKQMGSKMYYLLLGSGTHGAGHHHAIAQVFSVEGESFVKCEKCFEMGEDLIVEAPRSSEINLQYYPSDNELRHNEFIYNDESGFYEPTGKVMKWKLINGVFKQVR